MEIPKGKTIPDFGIMEERTVNENLEKCVICGKETDVPFDKPINERTGYIEGLGQLCLNCYWKNLFPGEIKKREEIYIFEEAMRLGKK